MKAALLGPWLRWLRHYYAPCSRSKDRKCEKPRKNRPKGRPLQKPGRPSNQEPRYKCGTWGTRVVPLRGQMRIAAWRACSIAPGAHDGWLAKRRDYTAHQKQSWRG